MLENGENSKYPTYPTNWSATVQFTKYEVVSLLDMVFKQFDAGLTQHFYVRHELVLTYSVLLQDRC